MGVCSPGRGRELPLVRLRLLRRGGGDGALPLVTDAALPRGGPPLRRVRPGAVVGREHPPRVFGQTWRYMCGDIAPGRAARGHLLARGGERLRAQSSACPRNTRLVLYERPVPHALARVLGPLRECGTERGRRRTTAMMMGAAHTRRPGRRCGRSRPGGGADERRKRPSVLASGLGGRRICSFELEAGVLTMPLVRGGHRRPGSRISFVSHIPPRNATTPREMEHRRHISHLSFFDSQSGVYPPIGITPQGGGGTTRPSLQINHYFPGHHILYPTPQVNIPGSPSVSEEGDCGNFGSL